MEGSRSVPSPTGKSPTDKSHTDRAASEKDCDRFGPADHGYAVSTYRYLRLAIVAVVLTLCVSVGLERGVASCWNGSVSAYYYTPVHSIFVAALGVIGVALIAIRGGTPLEEILLNAAGFLAPVVAFVPTGWSSTYCPSNLTDTSRTEVDQLLKGNHFFAKFSSNNLVAFIVGGLIAAGLASVVAMVLGKENRRLPPKEVVVPAIGSAVVVIAGFIWHQVWPGSFDTHAHSYAAILMFVLVGIVMISTGNRDPSPPYRLLYFACAGAMAVGGVLVVSVGALVTWRHQVLVLEIIEITVFVVFWFFQTIQLWNVGLSAPKGPTAR